MPHDEVCVSAHDHHGSVNIAENRLVTLGWSQNVRLLAVITLQTQW